jgi:hypothetical protein
MESKPLLLLEPQCRKDQRIVASNKIVKLKGGGLQQGNYATGHFQDRRTLFKDRYLYALATSLLQALVSVFMRAGILITHKHS